MPITREKIKPAAGTPLLLTLDKAFGTEVQSQINGTEWRYFVTTDEGKACVIYLPRTGHDAIQRLHPGDGALIELLRTRRGQTEYYDARFPDAEPVEVRTVSNGNGRHIAPPKPPASTSEYGSSSHLSQALCTALVASHECLELAKKLGLNIPNPDFSDLRAMANTIMIGDQKREAA